MTPASFPTRTVTLSLPPAERWTLHHMLLDRIEREATATDPADVDPPALAVFHAFETLDAGEARFTRAELAAMQAVLAEYHHAGTWWEGERGRLETLLHRVSTELERHDVPRPAD
jgi:hypothetical protein